MWMFVLIIGGLIVLALLIEYFPFKRKSNPEISRMKTGNSKDYTEQVRAMVDEQRMRNKGPKGL